jgi:hypothetical protein
MAGRVGRLSQQLSVHTPTFDLKHSDIGRCPLLDLASVQELVQPCHQEGRKIRATRLNGKAPSLPGRVRGDHEGEHSPGGIGKQLMQCVGGGGDSHIRRDLE